MSAPGSIVVLGASGLIGGEMARDLLARGLPVWAVARRFSAVGRAALGQRAVENPLVELDAGALASLLARLDAAIVVNCVGVLQDGPGGSTDAVHRGFVAALLAALERRGDTLLVHVSIPGRPEDDRTAFSRTKHAAEQAVAENGAVPYAILRPGFVVASAAYGGSALLRGLAAMPVGLPAAVRARPFAATEVADIAETVAQLTRRWSDGERSWRVAWDVMEERPGTLGDAVAAFRQRIGAPEPLASLPGWLLDLGSMSGDLAGRLGWSPPVRTTALRELRRGVAGDPGPWVRATGIVPRSLRDALGRRPATVQELWFSRLYPIKALIIAALVVFWIVSGAIALGPSFGAAVAILVDLGFSSRMAAIGTAVSSLADISVGIAIAWRRTCRAGLLGGIVLSAFYLVGAAVLAPGLWLEPLGALVKTIPAIVLMLVALATLENR